MLPWYFALHQGDIMQLSWKRLRGFLDPVLDCCPGRVFVRPEVQIMVTTYEVAFGVFNDLFATTGPLP